MSKEYIGALIVFAPPSGALNYDSTGTELDSAVKQKLLVSIFERVSFTRRRCYYSE